MSELRSVPSHLMPSSPPGPTPPSNHDPQDATTHAEHLPRLSSPATLPPLGSAYFQPNGLVNKRKRSEADAQPGPPPEVIEILSSSDGEQPPPKSKRFAETISIDSDHSTDQPTHGQAEFQPLASVSIQNPDPFEEPSDSERKPESYHTSHPNAESKEGAAIHGPPNPGTQDFNIPHEPKQIDEPVLCQEQQDLVDLILSGRNVFYTGSAGCGKSTVLKAAVQKLREKYRTVYILAPTGRAALQVDGMTTWSYMGWTPDDHKLELDELIAKTHRKHVAKRLRSTDVLIIDEISMVENHHLERMNQCLGQVRSNLNQHGGAFGGLQVIVTGDFCQLPPVKPFQFCMFCGREMTMDKWQTRHECPGRHGPFPETDKWAFQSQAWKEANFAHVHLREIHRQNDEQFIKMLQKCRLGVGFSPAEKNLLMNHDCKVHNATRLLCTKEEVFRVNKQAFQKLTTPVHEFKTVDGFKWNQEKHHHLGYYNDRNPDGTLKALRDHRIEPRVTLRVGMIVVLQVNLDLGRGLCNGSQGLISGFKPIDENNLPRARQGRDDDLGPMVIAGEHAELKERQIRAFARQQEVKFFPEVVFHNGYRTIIYPSCMVNSVGEAKHVEQFSLLHRTQIPLVAGWAMSVHKSQGMTLNRVIVDLTRAFEEGQVYVALSRATDLQGLKIEGDSKGLHVGTGGNDEVQRFLNDKFGLDHLLDRH